MNTVPDLSVIRAAHERIKPYIHRTPVMTNATVNELSGADIYFKCENLQKGGAFKMRGACNAILSLNPEEAARGVVTHSSGNHAQAVSLAARIRGIPAYIVMPTTAPEVKKVAVAGYGGKITFCERSLLNRETNTDAIIAETGAVLIHPYDSYVIIAGAATAGKELIEDCESLDFIFAPVGGGGLISGTALSARYLSPGTQVIGCEPENADDAFRSLREGRIFPPVNKPTVADGLLTSLCEKTFGIIREHVREIITVSEEEIIHAMRMVWERMKIIIEPSSAVAIAPVLSGKIDIREKRAGVIFSGGNVDLENLPF